MKIKQIAKILCGQDGVVFKNELFRLDHNGNCSVYNLNEIKNDKIVELKPFATFVLDKINDIVPHSNSVFWGTDYFDSSDEFPLLYTNVYNSPSKHNDDLLGAVAVYRLERAGESFKTTLVQIIKIGFTENLLWKTYSDKHGVRPYGNFAIDMKNKFLYAFVMKNEELGCSIFKFNIPKITDGELDKNYNVNKLVLTQNDILTNFNYPYQYYVQGATIFNNKLYSTEGFSDNVNKPAIKIIDLDTKQQETAIDLYGKGYKIEPEMIDFENGVCYYADAEGNLFNIEF